MPSILVCGGRDYGHVVRSSSHLDMEPPAVQARLEEYKHIHDFLHELINNISAEVVPNDNWMPSDITIIHGGATGADSAAGDFANVHFCQELCFPADWNKYGMSAGPIRNKQMLDEGCPDLVVAFPGGKGTANMVAQAKKAGIKVIEVGSKGSTVKYPELKTERYRKVFIERMAKFGAVMPSQKMRIFLEVIDEETKWLKSIDTMDHEYNEIIGAQQVMDDLK